METDLNTLMKKKIFKQEIFKTLLQTLKMNLENDSYFVADIS